MDIEKLIERLKQKDGLWCSVPTGENLIADAATALATLQAENEKLRAKLEQAERCIEIVENQRDQMKRERDAAIDCIYKIEDALDRGNDNDWARDHISEWESQKEG